MRNIACLVLLPVCLFFVSINGCGGDEETAVSPMAELEGRYTLDSVEWNVDGITVSLRISETDDIAGELVFGAEGLDASYTLTFPEGETDSVLGVPWHATATTLTIAGEPVPYTWDGTYLEFSTTAPDGTVTTIKWRKR